MVWKIRTTGTMEKTMCEMQKKKWDVHFFLIEKSKIYKHTNK